MICGHCKTKDVTSEHVRTCAGFPVLVAPPAPPTEPAFDVRAAAQSIPNSRYALQQDKVRFYEIRQGKKTQSGRDWTGFTFLDELFGAPGEFSHTPVKRNTSKYADIIKAISSDPEGALRLFGQKTETCGKCASPLSTLRSRASGYGQKCANKFGYWYATEAEARAILGEEVDLQPTLAASTFDVTNVR